MKGLKITFITSLILALVSFSCKRTSEQAVAEHAGKEHAGKEHAGKEHAGKAVSAMDIKNAMNQYIQEKTKEGNGVFKIDDKGQLLQLKFVKIHDPVRKIEGKGFFACTDFSVANDKSGKLYDLDFWLNPKDGKLVVTETKIHKHPVLKNGKWLKEARYTFINDKPVELK
jgi:hypothetical protein